MSEELRIARLGHRGDGIADTPAGAVYVSYALPGETAEVEAWPGQPDRRRLLRIIGPSAERVAAKCPHFGSCGGCAFQHWRADDYRAWKRGLVVDALAQAGLEPDVDALIDAHGEGRRRAVFHARRSADGTIAVGFAAPRAHDIVAIEACPILAPALADALPAARAIAAALAPADKPLDIQMTATETGLDVDVRGSGRLDPRLSAALARIAERHGLARITRHGELVMQRSVPTLTIGRARVALPPGAFLQPTVAGEAALADLVAAHGEGARALADLFAGVGPFALRLAEQARVTAIDSDAAAIEALGRAAAATPGLKPVEAQVRDLFRRPLGPLELKRFDCVVFDPPRQGAEAQARQLATCAVPRLVAVSCNPATFARDAAILTRGGYRLSQVTPVDQFRYSTHVEIVARFEK